MDMFGGDMSPAEYKDMEGMMDSEGGDAAVYYEEEQCEGCGSEMMEEKQTCNECGGEMREGECMECGSLYEEIDEDLHESFSENRKQIKEMMNRFNKFN